MNTQERTTGGRLAWGSSCCLPWNSASKESTCHAEDPVWFLSQEDLLENGQATYSNFPGWRCRRPGFCPWVGKIHWRRACNPLQYSCLENPRLENPHGQWSLVGCSPWGCKESDTIERLSTGLKVYLQEKKRNLYLIFGQKGGKLYLLLNFLWLKIIFMSKRHSLRWHILISFSGFRFWERNQNANNLFRVTNAEARNTEPVGCLKRAWSKEMDSQESCYQNWILEYSLPFN